VVKVRGIRTRWRAIAVTLAAGVALSLATVGLPALGTGAETLPACPNYSTLPVKPIAPAVKAALVKYYAARHLTPITVDRNRESILNLVLERVGVHYCRNLGGGRAGYVGVVPKQATAAVMVHVRHRAYAVTGSAYTFVTLAKIPGKGWKVLSDDTGP